MKIERMKNTAACGSCGSVKPGTVLIQAVDTSPVINTLVLCPECLARLHEMLGIFAAPFAAGGRE